MLHASVLIVLVKSCNWVRNQYLFLVKRQLPAVQILCQMHAVSKTLVYKLHIWSVGIHILFECPKSNGCTGDHLKH